MKKVLAWAVALALVLSSFTMAFADQAKTSKDFKDASQIQYTEAVDVMVATGVINGYPDGTFGPQKTVKRSEMAKMISVMLEGGEDIGDQYKSACPFKDSQITGQPATSLTAQLNTSSTAEALTYSILKQK